MAEELPGVAVITFHENRFGFGPCEGLDSVLVVCYDDTMVHYREPGIVYGDENGR